MNRQSLSFLFWSLCLAGLPTAAAAGSAPPAPTPAHATPIAPPPPAAPAAPEALEAEVAFVATAKRVDGSRVQIQYRIQSGHYLYRDRFRLADPSKAGNWNRIPKLPAGKLTEDATFGRVETYRQQVTFALPVPEASPPARPLLVITSQGCAESGVCFAPLTHRFDAQKLTTIGVEVTGEVIDRAAAWSTGTSQQGLGRPASQPSESTVRSILSGGGKK